MDTGTKVFGNPLPTLGAKLGRILGGHFDYLTTSLFRFEAKNIEEAKPGYIPHRPIKRFVVRVPAIHLFDANCAIVFEKLIGELKMKITSLVKYLLMGSGHKNPGLLSTVRALNSTREALLPHCKHVLRLLEEAWVADLCAVSHGEERLAAHINAYDFIRRGQRLCRHIFAGEAHIPPACRFPTNGDGLNIALNGTGEPDLECADIPDSEGFAIEFPASLFESKGIISISALKSGKPCFGIAILNPAKESLVGFIKTSNHFLKALRTYGLIFRERIFEAGEFFHLGMPGDRLVVMPVGCDALFKGGVVEMSTEVNPSGSVLDGLKIRLNAIFEGLSHCSVPLFTIARNHITVNCFRKENEPHSSPALKCGAF
jgi:hypothetical protein